MTKDIWEQNLTLLRSRYPELAEQIENSNLPHSTWFVEQTPGGHPTLLYRESNNAEGILIHSRRDPYREGQRQAEAALEESTKTPDRTPGVIILLGFGLGYIADTLAEDGRPLIIVERYMELFTLALGSRNLEKIISPGKAMFVLGEEAGAINAALALTGNQKPLIVKNRALIAITENDKQWYEGIERRISTWASKEAINAATMQRFGKRWTKNLAANMEGILHYPGIKHLENILLNSEIPVFLAAAGPSLDKVKNHLEEIRRRCVIAAVDTALRFLLRSGIEPDFVVSVDPQYWNAQHLHRLRSPNAALIAESAVYPSVLRNHSFSRVFFCQSLFPLGRFIEDRTDPKGILGAGGSVATSAWDFARFLGPSALWIAGLDLSFPGYHTHYKGALFEENVHAASWRLCPAEMHSVHALESGIPFSAASADGGKVLTDKRLSLYAAWFENRIEQNANHLTNYRLSSGGLAVNGLVPGEAEHILSLPERREEIDKLLKNVYNRINNEYAGEEEKRKSRYSAAFLDLIRGLEEIRDNAADAAKTSSNKNDTEKILKKLDKANALIAVSPVKDAAGFLFPPIAELEKELIETDQFKRHLEFSRRFYRSLEESVDYTLKCIKQI